ncbi:hypothetical protein [Metabacillus sediminilitoris]|nr:hypothetical protein [Metabacillus sediminilitoris]QGQ45591.1 hypothetical protein GMB29_10255 [Metabacillus sediminilitoris]
MWTRLLKSLEFNEVLIEYGGNIFKVNKSDDHHIQYLEVKKLHNKINLTV